MILVRTGGNELDGVVARFGKRVAERGGIDVGIVGLLLLADVIDKPFEAVEMRGAWAIGSKDHRGICAERTGWSGDIASFHYRGEIVRQASKEGEK